MSTVETEPKGSASSSSEPHKHVLKWDDNTFGGPGWSCVTCDWRFAGFRAKELVQEGRAVMEGPEEPQERVCGICEGPHGTEACKGLEEPEEDPYRGLAGNCGTCGAKGTDEVPEEGVCVCGHPEGDHSAGLLPPYSGCDYCKLEQCGGYRTEADAETAPVPIPRRPPYAVAYAVEGGALYEVAVPGDATVVAEDGVLMVLHPKKPVLAIVKIQPMNMEES